MHPDRPDSAPCLTEAEVCWQRSLAPGYHRMRLDPATGYRTADPGQFVMLGLAAGGPRLLRRPFSIHRRWDDSAGRAGIELLYKVVGPTTRAMAALGPGARVTLLGPLGRGFAVPAGMHRVTLAAGGVGVAPLVFLAEHLAARGPVDGVEVLIGGRGREDVLCVDDFRRLGLTVTLTSDDGSVGDRCLVTLPLERRTAVRPPELICACGPPAMLGCVAEMAAARRIPCQVSVEALMACGLGACLGCAVPVRDADRRYRHVCLDGPVFDAARLEWGRQ